MTENFTISQKDELLYELLRQLKFYRKEMRSVVAAGIFRPESHDLYMAQPTPIENNTEFDAWHHAEHEVLAMNRGEINLTSACAITTLGPCVLRDPNRPHDSCTKLLVKAGITELHTGSLDYDQATLHKYQSLGLTVTATANPLMKAICDELKAYFRPENRQTGTAKIAYIDHALAKLD